MGPDETILRMLTYRGDLGEDSSPRSRRSINPEKKKLPLTGHVTSYKSL